MAESLVKILDMTLMALDPAFCRGSDLGLVPEIHVCSCFL